MFRLSQIHCTHGNEKSNHTPFHSNSVALLLTQRLDFSIFTFGCSNHTNILTARLKQKEFFYLPKGAMRNVIKRVMAPTYDL